MPPDIQALPAFKDVEKRANDVFALATGLFVSETAPHAVGLFEMLGMWQNLDNSERKRSNERKRNA